MAPVPDSNAFFTSVSAYEHFMGRYARPLAEEFAKSVPLALGDSVLDIGCGPGALTSELVELVGAESVSAIDPSPAFLEYCANQYPGIVAKLARAESLPFEDHSFDAVLSQLVIHFVEDLQEAGSEIMRVIKPGGHVAVCTWNVNRMEKINLLPRAAHAAGIDVPDLRVETFNEEGEVADYLESIGLDDVEEFTISVSSLYSDIEELWSAYMAGVGPLGPWIVSQPEDVQASIRRELIHILNSPEGEFTLSAVAHAARGTSPE